MHINFSETSVDDLTHLLRMAMLSDDPESYKLVESIMIELEQRGIVKEVSEEDIEMAYRRFIKYKENFETHKKEKPSKVFFSRIPKVASITVIICVAFFTFTAYAAKMDVFTSFARWTKDTFQSFTGRTDNTDNEKWGSSEIDYLTTKLDSLDIDATLPNWLPEEYKFFSIEVNNDIFPRRVTSWFVDKDENFLSIQVLEIVSQNHTSIGEMTEDLIEIYETHDISHFLMHNNTQTQVIWLNNDLEICIQGQIPINILKKVVDSIYEGV